MALPAAAGGLAAAALLPDSQPASCWLAGDDKGKAAATEVKGNSMLDDDTLQCAICFDLCVRPVTVRLHGLVGRVAMRHVGGLLPLVCSQVAADLLTKAAVYPCHCRPPASTTSASSASRCVLFVGAAR